jgi:peptidoglycan hydrolase-like protein with peptidoglycan-binding domain
MRQNLIRKFVIPSLAATAFVASTGVSSAQGRRTLPEGTVLLVRTQQPLESQVARTGQTFETDVIDTIDADGYTLIPRGSRIRGVVTYAQAATRNQSGVIQVTFDQLTLTDGSVYPLSAKLTSTDSAERRQIDADPNSRVVLYGPRGGLGAAIAAAGSTNRPASGILGALGSLLSEGRDVRLEPGTTLAVQLLRPLSVRTRGIASAMNANSVLTDADRIRAAQRELARLNYYRGSANGQLDDRTQRALVEYQIDKGITATGNLDWRTARSLGLTMSSVSAGDVALKTMLSPSEAASMRRAAQALSARERNELSIAPSGVMSGRQRYAATDIELWFSLSAFADNASVYEQIVTNASNSDGGAAAGRALVSAARRVDAAMSQANASSQVRAAWTTIRGQLGTIASDYR